MRLIDADKFILALMDAALSSVDEDTILDLVDSVPTVDAVPVVRCKDCKYWQGNNDDYPHEECRWGHGETPDADDFCSYGERKDGDAADGLASAAETCFVYCPNCGARMDGGSYAKAY